MFKKQTSLLVFLTSAACSSAQEPFALQLIDVPAAAGAECTTPATGSNLNREIPRDSYTLRLTFLNRRKDLALGHDNQRRQELLCYRIVGPGEKTELLLPSTSGQQLALAVEAFDANGKLSRAGFVSGVDIAGSSARVLLHPVEAQTCGYRARAARAFHSATLLPNGQVLFLGGLMGSRDGGVRFGGELFANASVGVFAPDDHSWKLAIADEPKLARAFHRAVLLPSPAQGPYSVLLLGGLMASSAAEPRVARRNDSNLGGSSTFPCVDGSACRYHFPFVPHENALPGESAIISYDPATNKVAYRAFPEVDPSLFPAVAFDPDSKTLALSGGATGYSTASAATQGFQNKTPGQVVWLGLESNPPTVASSNAAALRAGQTIVARSNGRFLVLGGNMEGDGPGVAKIFGEDGTPGAALSAVTAGTLEPTAWHTLNTIGRADGVTAASIAEEHLLWLGGYLLRPQSPPYSDALPSATTRRTAVAEDILVGAGDLRQRIAVSAGAIKAVGYHRATALQDGSVLVTGGAFQGKCPLDTIFCPASEMAVFELREGAVVLHAGGPTKLLKARYGHSVTRLLDNTLLVSGGLSIDADGSPEVVLDGERVSFEGGDLDRVPLWLVRGDTRLLPGSMAENNVSAGACVTRDEAAQNASSIKIETMPLPRTSKGRRSRLLRVDIGSD